MDLRIRGGIASDMTAPYTALESWIYDLVIAPGVESLAAEQVDAGLDAVPRSARVLDVGCGGGQIAVGLATRRSDLHVTGVDLSPQQVGRARHRAREIAERTEFVEGSVTDLPFPDASFDVVYSIASIKHWPDPATGLAECVRVLKPGGELIVVEADRGCRFEDAAAFIARTRVPWALRLPFLAGFRTFVAGQSLDLEDARELAAALELEEVEVSRLPGLPALSIRGRR